MRYPAGLQNAGKEFGICAARWRCRAAFVLGNRKYGFDHIPPEAGNDSQMPGQMHESRLERSGFLMIRRLQKPFIGGIRSRSLPIFRRFCRKGCEKRLFSTTYPQSNPPVGDKSTGIAGKTARKLVRFRFQIVPDRLPFVPNRL